MILAFGCSVTHGAELVYDYQSDENIRYSYPNIVAHTLGVECKNYAVCGISNEGIFHKIIDFCHDFDTLYYLQLHTHKHLFRYYSFVQRT